MANQRLKNILGKTRLVCWALLFLSLPVTSFPYFPPALGGAALVRPLVIYPLAALLLLVTLPRLLRLPLPRPFLPLLAFALVALVGLSLASLHPIEELRGISLLDRTLRNLLTLGLGMALYFTVALLPRDRSALKFSLRWLYAGMSAALLWGSLQALYVLYSHEGYFNLLNTLQRLVSTRRLFPRRVSGMTYEPNWFAEQISFLFMPWLLASVFSGQSVFRWRWRWLTVEILLLGWAAGILMLTYSRAGLLVFLALLALSVLLFWPQLRQRLARPASSGWLARLALGTLAISLLAGSLFLVGVQNNYFSRLWRYWTDPQASGTYLEYIAFSQRIAYWEAAFSLFERYPTFGAGLGNYAFYFEELLPDRPLYRTPELLRLIVPEQGRDRLVTPKNLHVKILAETGLVGFAAFLAFLLTLLGGVILLWRGAALRHPLQEERLFWSRAGVLGLAAFLLAGFSYDSFALPNMWVVFGLLTAAVQVYSKTPVYSKTSGIGSGQTGDSGA